MQVKIKSKYSLKQILILNTPEFALPFIAVLIYFALTGFLWGMFFLTLAVCLVFYALAVGCIWLFTANRFLEIDDTENKITVRRYFKNEEYSLSDTEFLITLYADTETKFCYKLTLVNNGKKIYSVYNTDTAEYSSREFYQKLTNLFDCQITDKRKSK